MLFFDEKTVAKVIAVIDEIGQSKIRKIEREVVKRGICITHDEARGYIRAIRRTLGCSEDMPNEVEEEEPSG